MALLLILCGCAANPVKSCLQHLRVDIGHKALHEEAKAEIFKCIGNVPDHLKKSERMLIFYWRVADKKHFGKTTTADHSNVLMYDVTTNKCYVADTHNIQYALREIDIENNENEYYRFIINFYLSGNSVGLVGEGDFQMLSNEYREVILYDVNLKSGLAIYLPFLS